MKALCVFVTYGTSGTSAVFFPLEYLLNSTPTFLESRYQTHPHAVLYAFSTALENPQSVDSLTENDFHQRNSRDKQIILRNHSMFY